MKILPIYVFNKQNFTGIIGYDDSVSQERRKYIRQHYENEIMPYQSIYEKEPRLDEYKLKQLIDFFAAKPKNIDGETIYGLPLSNVHKISDSRRYSPNIYRGSTLYDAPEWVIQKIKDSGIKTVINLADYGNSYRKKIEKNGLEYVDFNISSIRCNYLNENEKKNKLISFIKAMQKEYVYMGCEYGTYKTDAAVMINNLFNPKVKGYCKIYSPEMISDIPQIADEIYLNMTEKDKKELGWTPEFEQQFNKKIEKLLYF
ncbi:hypothetical protein J6N69_04740 [bacterium]|nr:hypothetical protein [bacterium]